MSGRTKITKRRRVRKKTAAGGTQEVPVGKGVGPERKDVVQEAKAVYDAHTPGSDWTTRELDALDPDIKWRALQKWRDERDSQLLRPSTKFDLTFYVFLLISSYLFMWFYYGIDLFALVKELLDISST